MEYLLYLVGNPELKVPSVHITGTKGKGSTAAYIAAILQAAGVRTGLYTSPHILTFMERIKLNEKIIPWKELALLVRRIKPAVKRLSKETKYGMPTFFEVYTALGILYFAEKKADVMVLEVGMGGRLDATNVVKPLVSVITNISLDHVKELGNTLAKIAKEKAGIIKCGVPVVSATQKKEVLCVLKAAAKINGSKLYLEGKDFKHTVKELTAKESRFNFKNQWLDLKGLKIKMSGRHQVQNASVAVAAAEIAGFKLKKSIVRIKRAIPDAILGVTLSGRVQVVSKDPFLVLDAAHNAASAKALLLALKAYNYARLIMVVGMSANKDSKGFLKVFEKEASLMVFVRSSNYRSAEPKDLLEVSNKWLGKGRVFENVPDGIKYAIMCADKKDLVCVTGSFYVLYDTFRFLKIKV
jgi:dihydrofolate synthase/folylpolyglutamate synthase